MNRRSGLRDTGRADAAVMFDVQMYRLFLDGIPWEMLSFYLCTCIHFIISPHYTISKTPNGVETPRNELVTIVTTSNGIAHVSFTVSPSVVFSRRHRYSRCTSPNSCAQE